MLSSKTHILFFSGHPEMRIKLLHWVYSWGVDQLALTGIGMQRLFLLVIYWLVCFREQTIAFVTAQRAEVFHKRFKYPTTWSNWNIWTMNTLNLSNLQALPNFSLACKIQFLKTFPKEVIQFLSEGFVNLLQGNLSKVKRSHLPKYRDKIHELFLKRTVWKQRRSLFSSQKGLLVKNNFPLRH